jgi:hypothetical protein
LHICQCCKLHRKLLAHAGPRKKGYCGLCANRDIVSGLKFVRCGHLSQDAAGQVVK